jgi:hypothetical protein
MVTPDKVNLPEINSKKQPIPIFMALIAEAGIKN